MWGDLHKGTLHFGRSSCLHTGPWAGRGPGETPAPPSGSSAHRPWAAVGGGSPAGTRACCDRKWTPGTRHIRDLCRFSSLQGTSGLCPDKRHLISSSLWGSAESLEEWESLSSKPSPCLSLSAPQTPFPNSTTYSATYLSTHPTHHPPIHPSTYPTPIHLENSSPLHLPIYPPTHLLPNQTLIHSSTYPTHHLSIHPSTLHPPTYSPI